MSYEIISNKHLYFVIDEDASDFNEDLYNQETITDDDLFEIVTYRSETTSSKRPSTTGSNTRTNSPLAYGRNNFNYRTSTTEPTTLEPWVYERYTHRYTWSDLFATPTTASDEIKNSITQSTQGPILSEYPFAYNWMDYYFTTPSTKYDDASKLLTSSIESIANMDYFTTPSTTRDDSVTDEEKQLATSIAKFFNQTNSNDKNITDFSQLYNTIKLLFNITADTGFA